MCIRDRIVGASPWTNAFAKALKDQDVEVLLVDGAYHRLKPARMEGIDIYYGEILSEHAEHTLETPVSYTHLDVYKRQGQDRFPVHAGGFDLYLPRQHRRHTEPVSYTHLDVYKRQVMMPMP